MGTILLVVLFSRSARAEEAALVERARVLDESARVLFEHEDYQGALEQLEQAQELLPAPTRLYNMARCYEHLGLLDRAINLYQQYVDSGDLDAMMRGRATERIEWLLGEQQRQTEQPQVSEGTSGRRRLTSAAFYAALGVTAASAVTMTVLGAITLARESDYDAGRVDGCAEARDQGQHLALSTDVFLGVMAAGAVATLVLGLFTDFSGRSRQGSRLAIRGLGFSPSGLRVRF